mgnify:CR=1 FL=1
MSEYHEPADQLPDDVKDAHRALVSLQEEIEAVDWYNQRHAVCTNPSLAKILAHNRDEEIEHAAMTLEWLRRTSPVWERQLRKYLFTDGPITEIEDGSGGGGEQQDSASGLGIGSRRQEEEK